MCWYPGHSQYTVPRSSEICIFCISFKQIILQKNAHKTIVPQQFFKNWFQETHEPQFSMSLLFFQLINHLLDIRTWVKHNRIQYHTGTDYSASSEEWQDTKKSQQGILPLQYDGIYLATTFILYAKSHLFFKLISC